MTAAAVAAVGIALSAYYVYGAHDSRDGEYDKSCHERNLVVVDFKCDYASDEPRRAQDVDGKHNYGRPEHGVHGAAQHERTGAFYAEYVAFLYRQKEERFGKCYERKPELADEKRHGQYRRYRAERESPVSPQRFERHVVVGSAVILLF